MLRIICSSVLLICALSAQANAGERFPFLGEVSKESVNVRAGASTNFEKLDQLSRGAQVVVLGRVYEWYKIQLPSTAKVYIRADYLQMKEGFLAQLIGDKVNVRARPDSESASLGQLSKGIFVKVLEQVNGWCRIEAVSEVIGFVHQDFLVMKSQEVPASVTTKPVEYRPKADSEKQKVVAAASPSLKVTVKGVVAQLPQVNKGKRYQLLLNGQPAYFLEEGAIDLKRFVSSTVNIEGNLVEDKGQQLSYPVIRITKITLVL